MTKPIIYLAAPYSHDDIAVVEARFDAINRAAASLIEDGHTVFSPISMTHPIAMVAGNHLDTAWYGYDEPFMEVCAEIWVLMLPGWMRSRGVAQEIAFFEERDRPVVYLTPKA